jgi:hypothetical protein
VLWRLLPQDTLRQQHSAASREDFPTKPVRARTCPARGSPRPQGKVGAVRAPPTTLAELELAGPQKVWRSGGLSEAKGRTCTPLRCVDAEEMEGNPAPRTVCVKGLAVKGKEKLQ